MNTQFKKLSSLLTQEVAQELVKKNYIVIQSVTDEGIEVRDMRPLVARLENPIKGRGVIRYFGDTHFIVSEKLAQKIGAKP